MSAVTDRYREVALVDSLTLVEQALSGDVVLSRLALVQIEEADDAERIWPDLLLRLPDRERGLLVDRMLSFRQCCQWTTRGLRPLSCTKECEIVALC